MHTSNINARKGSDRAISVLLATQAALATDLEATTRLSAATKMITNDAASFLEPSDMVASL
jgi:hypothetical protein